MSSNPKGKHLMNGKETGNGFDKNPQNINTNGRPKKGISLVNAELAEKGYEPATKSEIEANYLSLLQLEEQELKLLLEDKTKPMLIRILIKNMLGGKGFDIIEKMLDRGIGKPKQTEDINMNVKGKFELKNDEQIKIKQALGENII